MRPLPHAMTCLLLGLVSATGFAPLDLWPVTLTCLAIMLRISMLAERLRSVLLSGWLFGVGHFVLGLNWIATAFTFQANMPAWLGWIAVVLLSLYLAIYPALAFLGARLIGGRLPLAQVIAFAGCWVVSEWLRSWVISGFAWNPLGVILVPPGLAAPSIWIGTYGLGALAALLAGGLFLLSLRKWRATAIALGPAAILIVMAWLVPQSLIADTGKPRAITIVQPNISQADKWEPGFREENFQRLARETVRKGDGPRRLIFWPEVAIPDYLEAGYPTRFYPDDEGAAAVRARLTTLMEPEDILITGGIKLGFDDQGQAVTASNSVFSLDRQGRILGSYDKSHLVPFGEYLPFEDILSAIGLSRLTQGGIPFAPGPGPRNIPAGDFGTAGLQVCYEIIFSGHVVDPARRPDFLLNPSNDAWFGAWGPPQHLAQARLRAIEEGLPVIRATPTGISAVIDSRGRILHRLGAGKAGHIDADIPVAARETLFARIGNLISLIFATAMLMIAVAIRRFGHYGHLHI
ncbi:MAG: apolipoprotein N-acyltransferase [Blastomonas sp.]